MEKSSLFQAFSKKYLVKRGMTVKARYWHTSEIARETWVRSRNQRDTSV